MTLLAGLGGARAGGFVLAVLPGGWLAGMAAGWALGLPAAPAWLIAVATVLLGALVASDRRLRPGVVIGSAAALGAPPGHDNRPHLPAPHRRPRADARVAASPFPVRGVT